MMRSRSIYAMPSLGGQERRLIDIVGPGTSPVPTFSWSPDGTWLAVGDTPAAGVPSRIVRVDLDTLERSPLTSPPAGSRGDSSPEISPDGRRLAFVRQASSTFGNLDIWIQPLDGGGARQLTFGHYDWCCDLTWTSRSDEIVFGTGNRVVPGSVLRVPVAGGSPTPVAGIGESASFPTTRAGRMVFSQFVRRSPVEIWRTPGRKAPPASRVPRRLIASSQNDSMPAYSPDGRKIAFESDRSGSENIWVADADGTHPTPLTTFAIHAGSPHWSPVSRKIVFDSWESGNPDIHFVDAAGGVPRRLTREPSEDVVPTFSRDGRSVYFCSDRGGQREIWRIPADGGAAVQVTRDGGYFGEESWDGQYLYFVRSGDDPVVWRMPVVGGAATQVLQGPHGYTSWAVSRDGIYYATSRWLVELRSNESTVSFFDFHSGHAAPVFTQRGPVWPSTLTVSPDEAWIVRHQHSMPQSELMLVENFR